MIVLDTNVVSELMRPRPEPRVAEWVGAQNPLTLTTTTVTVAEVLYGIHRLPSGRRQTELFSVAERVFAAFESLVLPFDIAAAHEYAALVTLRDKSGSPITMGDGLIAAICKAQDATLATRNIRDFAHLGLPLIDPWPGSA